MVFLVSMERWWGGSFSLHLWSISVSASLLSQMTCCISATLEGFNWASCKMHPISAFLNPGSVSNFPQISWDDPWSLFWPFCHMERLSPIYLEFVLGYHALTSRFPAPGIILGCQFSTGLPNRSKKKSTSPRATWADASVKKSPNRMVLFTHIADQISLDQYKSMFGNTWTVG